MDTHLQWWQPLVSPPRALQGLRLQSYGRGLALCRRQRKMLVSPLRTFADLLCSD